ncbi:unnamed protein product [Ixodes pacificus]
MSGSNVCVACLAEIAADVKCITCSVCRNEYHFGQSCAGITEASYAGMGAAKREKWRCKTCRTQENRSGAQSGAFTSQGSSQDNASVLDALLAIKSTVDTLLTLPAKVDELLTLKPTVERMETHMQELETKVDSLSAKYDTVLKCTTTNEEKITQLEKKQAELQVTVNSQEERIQTLREDLNSEEQYSRIANLEIQGLPTSPNEDLRRIVSDLAAKLELSDFTATDILAIHRLPAKPGSIPIVLVKFASAQLKERWLGSRGKLRVLVQAATVPKLFFNENLTKQNRHLHWMVREKAKEKQYKFTWVKNGKIFAKKNEASSLLRINRVADLDKIV